jgi:prevent-host-death family protein
MDDHYSIYEAKAQLSAIVRAVREGRSAVITVHGEPVAQIRPYQAEPITLAEQLQRLQARGELTPAENSDGSFQTVSKQKGALARFLDERGE